MFSYRWPTLYVLLVISYLFRYFIYEECNAIRALGFEIANRVNAQRPPSLSFFFMDGTEVRERRESVHSICYLVLISGSTARQNASVESKISRWHGWSRSTCSQRRSLPRSCRRSQELSPFAARKASDAG